MNKEIKRREKVREVVYNIGVEENKMGYRIK